MAIHHHLSDDLLVSHAAGSLAEGWGVVVASHLSLCPECRERYALAEATGGLLLTRTATPTNLDQSWQAVRARLDGAGDVAELVRPDVSRPRPRVATLPLPLRQRIGGDLDAIRWQNMGGGGSQFRIPTRDGETRMRLLRFEAGCAVPEHGHGGREMSLVLTGAFTDRGRTFVRGDVIELDDHDVHTPVATMDGECICLLVTDAPLRFRSWLIRLFAPIFGL